MTRLDPASLISEAEKQTGLSNWGAPEFLPALERLCKSANEDGTLVEGTKAMLSARILDQLKKRLLIYADRARHPEIAQQKIKAPLIVTGFPRSGTTILHGLLASDPAARSPLRWELENPSPPPRTESFTTDPRIAISAAGVEKIDPQFLAMHSMAADMPEECNSIMMMGFASPNYGAAADLPSYMEWLYGGADVRPSLHLHHDVLQHFQAFAPRDFWVLKAPPHLFWLDQLLEIYPDAKIIVTHRDPAEVLASNGSLIAYLRGQSGPVNKIEVGQEGLEQWYRGVGAMMKLRRERDLEDRIIDVQFSEFVKDQVGIAHRIYDQLGIPFTTEAEAGMRAFADNNKKGKHGGHHYTAEEYGLEPDKVRARFSDYLTHFKVPVK